MSTNNSILLTVPVTMEIGPIPATVKGPAAIFSFGIQNFGRILGERGVSAQVDGERAIATFSINGEAAKSQTAGGIVLDGRDFRIQPCGDNQHQLEISNDLGESYTVAGTFTEYDFANAIGAAWVAGQVEKTA